MASSIIQKTIITLLVIALIVGLGYVTYVNTPDTSINASDLTGVDAEATGQDVLAIVAELQNISISQKIFSVPLFKNLKDFSVPIIPEQHGRVNPFVSIDGETSNSGSSSAVPGGVTR